MNGPLFLDHMSRIRVILSKDEDWLQLSEKEQHRIIWDIALRFLALSTFWGKMEAFVVNYSNWVERYIRNTSTDYLTRYDMWEKWSDMLRELHTGF